MVTRGSVFLLAVLVVLGASGCGGGDGGSHGLPTMGMSGIPSPVLVAQNILLADASLNGHPGARLLADTGSPFTIVDAAAFPGATLPAKTSVEVDLTFGALTVDKVPAIQGRTTTMDPLALGGIVGGNLFRQFSMQFDYRDGTIRFGKGAEPADVATPGTSVSFALEGGGRAQVDTTTIVDYPATRVPITVKVDGVDHPFIVDTGASEVAVRSSLFSSLTADGRAVLRGLPVGTASGAKSANVTRAKSLVLSGESVANAAVMSLEDDTLLDNLASEVQHPLDGLLGGDFLREFLVTIDYPGGVLRLQRYGTLTHVVDDFQRVGLEIADSPAGGAQHYAVVVVFASSDAAAKGVVKGDQILSIDGKDLSSLDPVAADALLSGTPGDMRRIGFGHASALSLNQATVDLRVDDLIPAPQ